MKQLLILLALAIVSTLQLYGQSDKIDHYFRTELPEFSMDSGDLTYLDLLDILQPDTIVSELSDGIQFYYAEIRADQFGVPIALSIPLIINEEKIAVFIPNDESQVNSFINILSENISPDLDKKAISERLFIFIKENLAQIWTIGLENFDLKETNIQLVDESGNVRVFEIGFFEDNFGTKKMHGIHDITILFTNSKLSGIK